jgi:hypothetical protein
MVMKHDLREEFVLQVFENEVHREILGPKKTI